MHKPQIIHVIDSVTTGGAEILLRNTIEVFPEYRHLVVHLFPVTTLQSSFNKDVEFICVHHKGWGSIVGTVRKLRSIINQNKPQLVHSHLLLSNFIARLATPSSVPLFNSLHSSYSVDAFEKNRKSIWAERFTLRKRHRLIAVSNYVLEDYRRFIAVEGKTFVLYNFLPDTFYQQDLIQQENSPQTIKCIALGSLKEAKNYRYLLDLFSYGKYLNITLDVYGEGHLRKELQNRIDKESLPVRLCGNASITPQLLKKYDLFVQASSHEGFGLSLIEAMAAGVPVLVSDLPVFREVSGGFGHFFPLNNAAAAAEKLESLCKDPQVRRQFVEQGYAYCKANYSATVYKEKLQAIYQQ